ncbi:type VII secretion target [Nocardia sp. NBC_01327]|uniref:type VII secretion target n=1 Tax=Nocardia sp. NBC_01327 TaxID=2903593 RepID=UPI002E133FE6|nr:type VII secretion target [Nocardia sp. NBC_01327]
MPENLHIEPAVLRDLAAQHTQVAADTKAWATPPHDWLATFPKTYGSIAHAVHTALNNYYDARQKAGNALAVQHEQTAAALVSAADNYERADRESAAAIRQAGSPQAQQPLSHPAGPANHSAAAPVSPTPDATRQQPDTSTPNEAATTSSAPATVERPVTPGEPAMPGASVMSAIPAIETTTLGPMRDIPAVADSGLPATITAPDSNGAPPLGITATGPMDAPTSQIPATSSTGDGSTAAAETMPPTVLTPFVAAVAAAKEKESGPAYLVNAVDNEDLVIARTLLAAVLAAADSAVGLAWAVSVMRGPTGAGVFITTNEGRGWLPAGLYIPRGVSTPWLWDEMLGTDGVTPWEGVADPARVLAEFALAWGPKAEAKLTALVSSGAIDASLRSALTDVAVQDLVRPAYDVDLRVFTPDTADRLGLAASIAALESVAAVPDSAVRRRSVELAVEAHAMLGSSRATPPEAAEARTLRERILIAIQTDQRVPPELWQDLRDADDLLSAIMLSHRVDAGRIDLGALRVEDQATVLRTMVFERRSTELVLLLDDQPTRQTLRDMMFAHEQVVAHPLFAQTSVAAAVEQTSTPVVGSVSATPAVGPTPPSTVTVTPTDAPPALVPGIP